MLKTSAAPVTPLWCLTWALQLHGKYSFISVPIKALVSLSTEEFIDNFNLLESNSSYNILECGYYCLETFLYFLKIYLKIFQQIIR